MRNTLFLLGASTFLLAGCQVTDSPDTDDTARIANPASVNCVEQGGTLAMRSNARGEYGVCVFEDNRQCEEWALFRGDCPAGGVDVTGYENEADAFCAITGGTVESSERTVMCKRIDGTLCTAEANMNGDCPDPTDSNPDAGNTEAP